MDRETTSTMSVEEHLPSGTHTCRIESYSKKDTVFSEEFNVACCKWKLDIYPKGNGMGETSHLSMYLMVPDAATLPDGWCRETTFSLTLVNKHDSASITKETCQTFEAETCDWGFTKFILLTELHDPAKGYLVNDTLVVKVEIKLHKVVPPVELETHISRLRSYCSNLSNSFDAGVGTSDFKEEPDLTYGALSPSKDDIEKAKQYLKECLSDHFKLNMRDKLSSALSILCHSVSELSSDQQRSIETFSANFETHVKHLLAYERDNTDFELQKIRMDQISSALKKNYKTNLSVRESIDAVTKEENDLEKKLKEVNSKKRNLTYKWDTLINEADELKSKRLIQEKKLEEAEKSKKIAKETMSSATNAWSSLKEHFL